MQTLINIDEKLLAEAAQLVTTQNQSQLIEIALLEFIKNHQSTPKRDVRDLVGKVNLAPNYDYKKLRKADEHFVKPFDIYKQLELGEGGYARVPSSQVKAGIKATLRSKLQR